MGGPHITGNKTLLLALFCNVFINMTATTLSRWPYEFGCMQFCHSPVSCCIWHSITWYITISHQYVLCMMIWKIFKRNTTFSPVSRRQNSMQYSVIFNSEQTIYCTIFNVNASILLYKTDFDSDLTHSFSFHFWKHFKDKVILQSSSCDLDIELHCFVLIH